MIHQTPSLPFAAKSARLLSIACGLVMLLPATPPVARANDLGAQLVQQLFATATNSSLSVGVGDFIYQDTRQMSAFSALLNTQVTDALAKTPRCEPVTHDGLVEIQNGILFHGALPLDPGQSAGSFKITNPQALVRGRFFLKDSNVLAQAELVRLEDGMVLARASNSAPVSAVVAANPPGTWDFLPPNFEMGQGNIHDVERRLTAVPHDFEVELAIRQCKRNFAAGESYEMRIRVPQACYVAVFDHEVDGSTVLLFPNPGHTNTWIPGKIFTDIPSSADHGFFLRVSPPFGADVIQIIACTWESSLHRNMTRAAASAKITTVLASVSRELLATQISRLGSPLEKTNDWQWSEMHLVLSTYPAPVPQTKKPSDNLRLDLAPRPNLQPPDSK